MGIIGNIIETGVGVFLGCLLMWMFLFRGK